MSKPKVVCLSGSGFRLSYFVGLLQGLLNRNPENVKYTHCFGISGGALVSMYLAKYPIGQEQMAIDDLHSKMEKYIHDKIMEEWPLPFPFNMYYLYRYQSWYSGRRTREIIEEEFNDAVMEQIFESDRDREVAIVYYSFNQQKLVTVSKNELRKGFFLGQRYERKDCYKILRSALHAAVSATGIFPCVQVYGDGWGTDAGCCQYVPVEETIRYFDKRPIDLDIFLSVQRDYAVSLNKTPSTFEMLLGILPFYMKAQIHSDMRAVFKFHERARLFQPSRRIYSGVFDTNPKVLDQLFELGVEDGKTLNVYIGGDV